MKGKLVKVASFYIWFSMCIKDGGLKFWISYIVYNQNWLNIIDEHQFFLHFPINNHHSGHERKFLIKTLIWTMDDSQSLPKPHHLIRENRFMGNKTHS
jgi:hypothetical protein